MAYKEKNKSSKTDYDRDITNATNSGNSPLRDTSPMVEKPGYLGMDDLDRLRRKRLNKQT